MLLCTLSILVFLAVANSSGQREQLVAIESRVARDDYSVSQDIRDRVPVNFAAMSLRKSRLESKTDRKNVRHRPDIDEKPKEVTTNQPKRTNPIKNSTKQSIQWKHKGQKRKRPIDIKLAGYKKSPRFRDTSRGKSTSTQGSDISSKDISIEAINFEKNFFRSQLQTTTSSNALKQSDENSFENIKKAINALPQQMVKVVRDDMDCNDDPTKSRQNTRGPPCTYSHRWPVTGGHSSFWGKNNIFPQNWEMFY